jgi:hypothetical protein
MGEFETRDDHADPALRPLRFAVRREEVYAEAKTMVADLGWTLVRADDERLELSCERRGGFLANPAKITIRVEGPEGIPSATLSARSETQGGLRARDRKNVREFLDPFRRRVG